MWSCGFYYISSVTKCQGVYVPEVAIEVSYCSCKRLCGKVRACYRRPWVFHGKQQLVKNAIPPPQQSGNNEFSLKLGSYPVVALAMLRVSTPSQTCYMSWFRSRVQGPPPIYCHLQINQSVIRQIRIFLHDQQGCDRMPLYIRLYKYRRPRQCRLQAHRHSMHSSYFESLVFPPSFSEADGRTYQPYWSLSTAGRQNRRCTNESRIVW